MARAHADDCATQPCVPKENNENCSHPPGHIKIHFSSWERAAPVKGY